MLTNKYSSFYIFTVAIVILLIAPFLIQDGMFMDGQQYACVAQNLANGKGSFWHPIVTDTWIMEGSPYFLEHPPLFYNIESLVFRAFGNSMYSERVFCLLMAFANAYFIHLIWKEITEKQGEKKQLSWLPILLWIIIPTSFWALQNNMIEIVLSVFTLLSVLFSLKALLNTKHIILNLIVSGLCILAAFFTKGLPGLFPIMAVPLFYLVRKNITLKQAIRYTLLMMAVPIVCYFLITLISHNAKESMHFYFNNRLLNRIYTTGTINNRFNVIIELLIELLLPLLITLLLVAIKKRQFNQFTLEKKEKQYALFFFLLGLTGSLPLLVTMVQKNFYFLASLPFFAIALALVNSDYINQQINQHFNTTSSVKKLKLTTSIFLVLTLIISLLEIGKTSRDQEKLTDINYLGGYLRNEKIVSVDNDTYFDWSFQFYIYRKYGINLDPRDRQRTYIITKNDTSQKLLKDYKKIDLPLKQFKLYKQKLN